MLFGRDSVNIAPSPYPELLPSALLSRPDVHFVGDSGLWPRLRYADYTSDLPDPFAMYFYRSDRSPNLVPKLGRVPTLLPASITEHDFITQRSRGPFLLSITDTAAVAAIFAVPPADSISWRTRSRLAAAPSRLHVQHSRTPVLTSPACRCKKASVSDDRTASHTAIANYSQSALADTGGTAVSGPAASAGPTFVARAAMEPLANWVSERPGTSSGLPPCSEAPSAQGDSVFIPPGRNN